jgi:PAS domain S-box-containing protein
MVRLRLLLLLVLIPCLSPTEHAGANNLSGRTLPVVSNTTCLACLFTGAPSSPHPILPGLRHLWQGHTGRSASRCDPLDTGYSYTKTSGISFSDALPGSTLAVQEGSAVVPTAGLTTSEEQWWGLPLLDLWPVRALFVGCAAVGGLILALFLWNRSLRRAVRRRTAELEQSREACWHSEARYRELVEDANSIILRMDSAGRITFFNGFAEHFFGYRAEEVLGREAVGLIVPTRDSAGSDLHALITDLSAHPERYALCEGENMRRDGSRVWVCWTNRPLFDESGQLIGLLSIGTDATERRRATEALQMERKRLQWVISGSQSGTWEWNVQTGELVANETWAQMLGRTLTELEPCSDTTWAALVHPDDLGPARQALQHCFEGTTEAYDCEIRMRHRDGHWVWILDRGRICTRDPQGRALLMFGTHTDISGLKRTEEKLRRDEERLRKIFEILPAGLWITDQHGTLLRGNPTGRTIWGGGAAGSDGLSAFPARRLPGGKPAPPEESALARTLRTGATVVDELLEIKAADGTRRTILAYSAPVHDERGEVDGAILVHLDISDRKILEEQLIQAQKMESIGRLAGGVAHDFNNMLSVILGHTDLALDTADLTEPLRERLEGIREAVQRSTDLTQQLLAFARRQAAAPRVLNLNTTVVGMLKMVRRLIGEDIDLTWLPAEDLPLVYIDPSQVDQVLVNLCVNARDAIEDTGRITIETAAVSFDQADCVRHPEISPGGYVCLSVSDTGRGMDDGALTHLFEPFFTTKEIGKGTGLGLATVYGIIRQNDGCIEVDSQPNRGAAFRIYLPQHAGTAVTSPAAGLRQPAVGGRETILVVEDDSMILGMVSAMLTPMGYTVLSAATPAMALELAEKHPGPIDLLLTDVVMPEMNGRDLARRLAATRPGMRQMFMSGYTADIIASRGVLEEGLEFLQKPFTRKRLVARIRQVLDRQEEAA